MEDVFAENGFAGSFKLFRVVCLDHIGQIKTALGISGVKTDQSFWSVKPDDREGTQIDLIIERKDNVVNMCEMKYYNKEFASNKTYHGTIINRRELLEKSISKGMVVHSTLITTYGLKYNEYSGDFDSVITMEELFR